MAPLVDLTQQTFGRLTVMHRNGSLNGKPAWLCRCDCGNTKTIRGSDLRGGATLSCGCLRNDQVRAAIRTHGHAPRNGKRPEYNVWLAMRSRCCNPENKDFQHYGGRGISVCEQWSEYARFIADMGARPTPKHTIDRINVNGDYEPTNCRWATWSEQRRNTRSYIERHGAANA